MVSSGALSWWAAAADLLLGAGCPGCGAPWWGACAGCRAHLGSQPVSLTRPTPAPVGFPLAATAGPYDEIARGLIHAHKEEQALMLTGLLGDRLAAAVSEVLTATGAPPHGTVTLVPVPSSAATVRERGFDGAAALARRAARTLRVGGRPVTARRLLAQRGRLADQALLDSVRRAENLRDGLRLRRGTAALVDPLRLGAVVVVDDVVTTGASLTEAVRTLRRHGFVVSGAATVSATVRWSSDY